MEDCSKGLLEYWNNGVINNSVQECLCILPFFPACRFTRFWRAGRHSSFLPFFLSTNLKSICLTPQKMEHPLKLYDLGAKLWYPRQGRHYGILYQIAKFILMPDNHP
jgi:hypothetical protein